MLDSDKVFDNFCMFSGLSETDAEGYSDLCLSSAEEIEAQLIDASSAAANEDALCRAAAALAFYRMSLISSSQDTSSSFKAGDVTVTHSSGNTIGAAESIKQEYMRPIMHLLSDSEFVFSAIPDCRRDL